MWLVRDRHRTRAHIPRPYHIIRFDAERRWEKDTVRGGPAILVRAVRRTRRIPQSWPEACMRGKRSQPATTSSERPSRTSWRTTLLYCLDRQPKHGLRRDGFDERIGSEVFLTLCLGRR